MENLLRGGLFCLYVYQSVSRADHCATRLVGIVRAQQVLADSDPRLPWQQSERGGLGTAGICPKTVAQRGNPGNAGVCVSVSLCDLEISVLVSRNIELSGITLNNPGVIASTINFENMSTGIIGASYCTGHFPVTHVCCGGLGRYKPRNNYAAE